MKVDRSNETYEIICQTFLDNNKINNYYRNNSLGAVFAEEFNRTMRDLPTRPSFEKNDDDWIDGLMHCP